MQIGEVAERTQLSSHLYVCRRGADPDFVGNPGRSGGDNPDGRPGCRHDRDRDRHRSHRQPGRRCDAGRVDRDGAVCPARLTICDRQAQYHRLRRRCDRPLHGGRGTVLGILE